MWFEATILLKTKKVDWERTQIRSQFGAVFGLNWLGLGPLETGEFENQNSKLEKRKSTAETWERNRNVV